MNNIRRHYIIPILLLVTSIITPAWSDTLYLRAGEQEPGRLVGMTADTVQFEGRDGIKELNKADVLKVQLQRARMFDEIESVDQISDPELRACIEGQPASEDYPSAGFITLLQRHTLDLTVPDTVTDTVRTVTKVFQQRGEKVGTKQVWYFQDTDTPRIDFALTVTPDGRVLHLSDAALKSESINARFPFYERIARFRFACKEPRPGSILDVQHTVVRVRKGPLEAFHLEETFRKTQPMLRKEVVLLVSESEENQVTMELTGPDVVKRSRSVASGVVRLTWTLTTPQRGIVDEPHMPPRTEFVPTLTLGKQFAWKALAQAYAQALDALPPLPQALVEKAIALDAKNGPQAIHDFLARSIRTVPVSQRAYRMVPDAAEISFQRGMANELNKNYLFYKMLEAASIPCSFALVRSRNEGPLADGVPSLRAFNRSAVRLAKGNRFATVVSDVLPFAALPGSMHAAPALVVDAAGGALTLTQQPRSEEEREGVRFEATLEADGTLALDVTFDGSNNVGTWIRAFKDADEQRIANTFQQIAAYLHPAARLTDFETTELADLAVTPAITLRCTIPGYASKAGEALMLFDLPAVKYTAGDVGRPERTHDLFWGHVGREACQGVIHLPEGFQVYSAPEPVVYESPTVTYTASLVVSEGTLNFSDTYDLRVHDAPAEAYAEYKACKELRANLPRQRIILTK